MERPETPEGEAIKFHERLLYWTFRVLFAILRGAWCAVCNSFRQCLREPKSFGRVSRNYLASGYCKEELHMALKRGLDEQSSPVIVIIIDDIPKRKLPNSLKNKTFIDFTSRGEEQTWKRSQVAGSCQSARKFTR